MRLSALFPVSSILLDLPEAITGKSATIGGKELSGGAQAASAGVGMVITSKKFVDYANEIHAACLEADRVNKLKVVLTTQPVIP